MADRSRYKKIVLDTARHLTEERYLVGTGGNVSVLIEGEPLIAITPSSMDYLTLTEADICIVDYDRKLIEGEHRPSIEAGMHLAVYRNRPDVNAVVHTHQVFPSLFALINEPIPPLFDEQVGNLGGQVAVVPYGLSGSEDLLRNITAAVASQCNAYFLQNHGALLLGRSMEKAVINVKLLDKVAQAYYLALSTHKPVQLLPDNASALLFALMKAEQKKEADRKGGQS
jgi:ribulose-5-phosphate 4-epimerase/fuculose-1-phosphate aldolase